MAGEVAWSFGTGPGEILGWCALATTAATPAGAVPLLGGAVKVRALSLPLHAREKSHVLPRQVDNGAACAASFLKVPAWARWESAVVLGGGGWVAASSARDLEHGAFVSELVLVRCPLDGRWPICACLLNVSALGREGIGILSFVLAATRCGCKVTELILRVDLIPVMDAPFSPCCLFVQ